MFMVRDKGGGELFAEIRLDAASDLIPRHDFGDDNINDRLV